MRSAALEQRQDTNRVPIQSKSINEILSKCGRFETATASATIAVHLYCWTVVFLRWSVRKIVGIVVPDAAIITSLPDFRRKQLLRNGRAECSRQRCNVGLRAADSGALAASAACGKCYFRCVSG